MSDTTSTRTSGGVLSLAKSVKDEADRIKLTLIGAGVAFFGLLALFPGIGALMAVSGLLVEPDVIVGQMETLATVLPEAAAEIILGQARAVTGGNSQGLGLAALAGLTLTFYSASKAMQGLMDGLNLVHDTTDNRGMIGRTLTKMGLTLGLILGVLLCVAVAALVPIVLSWLPFARQTEMLVMVLRWPALLVIAACGIALTYRVAPSHDFAGWKMIFPGAALACVLWIVGSLGFAIYVRYFGSYNETFGAIGGTIILLVWMWLSACIVLLGAVLSKILEDRAK
ncbi:YihY/virulence factor BrkB family protein [Maribius pontilimi]|uniref:YihY/virulence factor BrkB family protein n=1 Tax=Palleronia pontilimi TaxID=1964209 RepID=A0A934IFP9_9RHOB|nr:YihY/virulence factor BrkB family protein [Palleronia pontilimi]MBJ3761750.1 YihY/virulence factor BrkB family protein [Palleronia pontilimi]